MTRAIYYATEAEDSVSIEASRWMVSRYGPSCYARTVGA